MQTREEKLATWVDVSAIPAQQDFRALSGSLSLDLTGNSSHKVRISEERVRFDELDDGFFYAGSKDGSKDGTTKDEDKDDSSRPWRFKVLSVPRLLGGRLVLSIPRPAFQKMQSAWHLHPRTIEVFLSNNGLFTTFSCPRTGREFFLLKVANSRSTGFDCVSITHDRTSRTTYVLYHHLHDEEAIFATLLATPESCLDPTFFIAALYRSHQQHIEAHRNTIDTAILSIERQTGYGKPGRIMEPGRRPSIDRGVVFEDPKLVIQQLSFCQTDLAIIRHVAQCCLDSGEWLMQVMDSRTREGDVKHVAAADASSARRSAMMDIQATVREDIEYTRRRAAMLLSQVQQMSDRTQSQTAFMLNNITQSDSEYTAAIAVDGKRDSIAMRTLSVLGIIYLPGTFVATFFSMDMFQWASGNSEGEELSSSPQMSPYMWIYWVVALPLTLATMVAWLFWTRRETDESGRRLTLYRSTTKGPKLEASTAGKDVMSVGVSIV